MFIILTYDVGTKRNAKVLKECRRYLNHVQKSVFEGFITEKQIISLKKRLQQLINTEEDQIAIYWYGKAGQVKKETIGYHLINDNIV